MNFEWIYHYFDLRIYFELLFNTPQSISETNLLNILAYSHNNSYLVCCFLDSKERKCCFTGIQLTLIRFFFFAKLHRRGKLTLCTGAQTMFVYIADHLITCCAMSVCAFELWIVCRTRMNGFETDKYWRHAWRISSIFPLMVLCVLQR